MMRLGYFSISVNHVSISSDWINRLVVLHSRPNFVVEFLVREDLAVVIDYKPLAPKQFPINH